MRRYVFCLLLIWSASLVLRVQAQQTQVYIAPDAEFNQALDFFAKQKYAEALDRFDAIVKNSTDKKSFYAIDAQYYAAVCATELFHKDAEIRLQKFLTDHPESARKNRVYYHLGRYNFRKKDYKETLDWFREIDVYDLQKDELSEYYFKRGYSHYELGHTDSASKDFFEIKDIDTKYSPAANYYYSHIAYTQGNYETALQGFKRLSGNETFGPLVPYYIVQIYYLQKRYEEVVGYAPAMLDSAEPKKRFEIAHIIGASYFRLGKYRESIPYYQLFRKGAVYLNEQEGYELGYAYYKSDSCEQALTYFQLALTDSFTPLNQNIWYHVADCYIKTGDKHLARSAFGKAASMRFDPVVREDALFNYARLSYELSFDPFNEAIIALNEYLVEYPESPRRDEAYGLLTNIYLITRNYKEALTSIEKIKILSPQMQPTYQMIAYNRGVELLKAKKYDDAVAHFNKSLTYPLNMEMTAMARYWKGEAYYAKAEFEGDTTGYVKAIEEYRSFQNTPGSANYGYFNTANYNTGYCYFEMKNWNAAAVAFRKYVSLKGKSDPVARVYDAYLRLGDAYFRVGDFVNANDFYGQAVALATPDARFKDYAMYQQAMALGYLGKKKEKADLLRNMRETYPNSQYLASSRYQEAKTLHDLRMYDEALAAYSKLYNDLPQSEYAVPCLMNMGLIYRAKNDNDNALVQYKKAVDAVKGKGTSLFGDLMREIKDIYVLKGQLDQWEQYAESVGYVESAAVADSTTYAVATKFYKEGNCAEVLKQCNKYISKYPSGMYITDIHHMRAECAFKANDLTTALGSYNAVIAKGTTKYTQRAIAQAALIYNKQGDYANAVRLYRRVEVEATAQGERDNAKVNLMVCYNYLKVADSAAYYAGQVLTLKGLPSDIVGQANFLKGNDALAKNDKTQADKYFKEAKKLLQGTEAGAEASYRLCWIKYDNKEHKTAKQAILDHIKENAGFSQWSGKGWLLLSDNYLAMKDTINARKILEYYIANGDVPELVTEAQQKLNILDALKPKPSDRIRQDLIIPMGEPKDEGLFQNEATPQPNNGGGQ